MSYLIYIRYSDQMVRSTPRFKMLTSVVKLLVVFLAMNSCFAAKFAMVPMFGRSNFMVLLRLSEELTSRGHEVSIYVGEYSKYAFGKPGVKVFPIPAADRVAWNALIHKMTAEKLELSPSQIIQALMNIEQTFCGHLLQHKDFMTEISKADLLIGITLYGCGTLIADMFSMPNVLVSSGPVCMPFNTVYGVCPHPSPYLPQTYAGLSGNGMTLMEKIKNLGVYLASEIIKHYICYPVYNELKTKFGIKPEKSIKESLSTFDLVLLASDFALDIAQPLPPNVRQVGYFLPSPAKPLPADLEEFMQSSGDDGVVLVSFGSMVNELHDSVDNVMASAFGQLPQKVLWKIKLDSTQKGKLAPNIKTVTWLPQNDILGHPKTKLFITHAGINGVSESTYHGVPMVCSPFVEDQFPNSQRVKERGFGEILSVRTASAEQLVEVMRKVIYDKSYKQNALRVSRAMKMRKRTPTQEAAELLEYVLAVGNMSYLRPRELDMPFYEVYMFDVLGVLAIALALIVVVLVTMVKLLVRMCLRLTGGKTKTE